MNKKINILYKIAGIVSIIVGLINIVLACLIIFDVANIIEIISKYTFLNLADTFNQNMTIIKLIISAFLNSGAARLYLMLSKATLIKGQVSSILFMAFAQILFGSLIGGIFGVSASMILNKSNNLENVDIEPNVDSKEYALYKVKIAIMKLKQLKLNGQISEEEYFNAINKVLEG